MTDPTRIYDDQHNNAPAVPQGWKLVPVEPTRAMWAAVNKLDDEMAAGSYDGKGCSIEQAWNCMLDFAPDAPALAATPAPAPAQEVEPIWPLRAKVWKRESTQEWVLDIDGTLGSVNMTCRHTQPLSVAYEDVPGLPALYQAEPQEVGLTDEEIEAIAKKHMSTVGDHWCNEEAIRERHAEDFARAIIAALRAKGGKHV